MGICYGGDQGQCRWTGIEWSQEDLDRSIETIRERALDLKHSEQTADRLRDLAQTKLATEYLEAFLADAGTGEDELEDWQVGEAVAEVVLESERGVRLPWNMRRDERVPRASLPGADLVGFVVEGDDVYLFFGEVKSSSDPDSPPNVLYGKKGMIQQLERIVDDPKIRRRLIDWLEARCQDGEAAELFDAAMTRWVESQGSDLRVIGCLVRDLAPRESDVSGRAKALEPSITAPGVVEVIGCYLPVPMTAWVSVVAA